MATLTSPSAFAASCAWPLPRDISLRVLKVLLRSGHEPLVVFAQVSRACHDLAADEALWRSLVLMRPHMDDCVPFDKSWRNTYIGLVRKARLAETRRAQMAEIRRLRREGILKDGRSLLARTKEAFRETEQSENAPIEFIRFSPVPVVDVSSWECEFGSIQRVNGKDLSLEEFARRFDIPRVPCLLTDVASKWPAMERWSLENIIANYGDETVSCAQYTKLGTRIKMTLRNFVQYMNSQMEDAPLYVFDGDILMRLRSLQSEYIIPEYFWQDLFVLLGKHLRPSYRWILLGPARTGSGFHFDPNGTTAWNALIAGRKRWTLYPPNRPPPGVRVEVDKDGYPFSFSSPDPLTWIRDYRPHLHESDLPAFEFTQQAGEIVFVPAGWWHQVLNLEPTVCVTHNLANEHNLDAVTEALLRDGNEDLLEKLQERLKMVHPRLYHLSESFAKKIRSLFESGQISRPDDRTNRLYKSYIVK